MPRSGIARRFRLPNPAICRRCRQLSARKRKDRSSPIFTTARFAIITIFLQTLYISLASPGHGAAEATALTSLCLLLGVPVLTGYAQWWEIIIIFAGLALVVFEIFVFPGHFVSGTVGVLMVVGGLV